MNDLEGFNLFKSARGLNKPSTPKYNVPNQGNHQTSGSMMTNATTSQTTTPMLKPIGGVTTQPVKVQTNNADKTSQAYTRQVKANYGTSIGVGSGHQQGINNMLSNSGFNASPKNNSYQSLHEKNAIATQGMIGKVTGAVKNAFKVFSDDSHVGAGINPQMLFQDMKVSKPVEVGCNSKKGKLITSDEVTSPPLRDDTGSIIKKKYLDKHGAYVTHSSNKTVYKFPKEETPNMDSLDDILELPV